jgi:translation elongation factor EF-Ts
VEQPFVMDPSKKISDIEGRATIEGFLRWAVGETA